VRSEIEQLSGQVLLASASFGEREVRNDATGAKLEAMAQAIRVRLPDAAAGLDR
jgi:hypothetical protein